MTFEADLIKYVINLAVVRGLMTTSKDLNSDWLPFETILEIFDEVCLKLGVTKGVEEKCYKTILKMCSSEEKHLTWAYKMDNVAKYFPLRTSTHAEKHTSSSWNRHKSASDTFLQLQPEYHAKYRYYSTKKSHHGINPYADFGLNLGTIRSLNRDLPKEEPSHSPPIDSFPQRYSTSTNKLSHRTSESYAGDRGTDSSRLYGFSLLAASPSPPSPPPYSHTPFTSSPPAKVSFSSDSPSHGATPPAVSYYKDYIPSSRISPIAHSNSPDSARKRTARSPPRNNNSHHHPTDATQSTFQISSLQNDSFGEEELLAMQRRVAAIELEAKKTRQVLSHIAYLKNRNSRSPSSPNSDAAALHLRDVAFGDIALSPYLKEVLQLPPAVILTDTRKPAVDHAVRSPRSPMADSPVYGHTPSVHHRYGTASAGTGSPHSRSFDKEGSRTNHSFESPSTLHHRNRHSPTPRARDSPDDRDRADFTATLGESPAMRKYLNYVHGSAANFLRSRSRSPSPTRPLSDASRSQQYTKSSVSKSHYATPDSARGRRSLHSESAASPQQVASAQKDALLQLLRAKDSSPAGPYHNSYKTQHSDDHNLTTIDSSIDEALGDSLNIEEKDGRVYVNFQSRFVL